MHRRPSRTIAIAVVCTTVVGCAERVPLREGNAPLLEAIATVAPVVDGPKPPPPSVVSAPYVESPYLNPNEPPEPSPGESTGQPLTFPAAPHTPQPQAPIQQPAGPPPVATSAAADAMSLQTIMAELQSLGTVDPETQRRLLADLQQTDPALWPMLMQTFRAGMSYRQKQADAPAPPSATMATANEQRAAPAASAPIGPDPVPPKVSAVGASSVPSVDLQALTAGPRGASNSPGLTFPAQSLLNAALAEAHRAETESASSPPPAADVKPASHVQSIAEPLKSEEEVDYRKSIDAAIAALERETQEPPHSSHEVTRHAWLRVLYLAAGRRDDALKPIPGIAAVEQDFWSEQLYALATYLDTEKLTDPARRSAEAARHLSKATSRLSEASTLSVKNLAFCTEVSSYGVFQKFKNEEFTANQALILYAEVENFKSEETSKGFHTALRSSYQILDAQGRRVAENDLALTEEYCQNLRRDYFLRYFLSVPERIYAGKYTLQLTIVDTLSQKIGQSSIEFTVVDK